MNIRQLTETSARVRTAST